MQKINLSASEWTQITQADDTDDAQVISLHGSFLLNLGAASEDGAMTVVMPPVPPKSSLQTIPVVPAGVVAFAKAIREPAMAQIGPATA